MKAQGNLILYLYEMLYVGVLWTLFKCPRVANNIRFKFHIRFNLDYSVHYVLKYLSANLARNDNFSLLVATLYDEINVQIFNVKPCQVNSNILTGWPPARPKITTASNHLRKVSH